MDDLTTTETYAEAQREDWARRTVAAAGFPWATHMAKFSGAVLKRPMFDVASAEAWEGRRGLLDSGPHAPRRRGRGIASGWADEEDYGPRYE